MPQIELPERYRVDRHIASGGMASVWEAQDLLLRRTVAIKVLSTHFDHDHGARARFQREARTAAQISDRPHIVTIYDIGEHHERAFIVMEYFAGGTVADRLRAARGADGAGSAIPRQTALRWLREAAVGLDVAHAAEIVHRDVKPANLMLDAHDRLAVGDFGIARLADDTQMTQTGQVLGTAAYLSPEQALGQPATPASDRYALAVVAYELLTGARPFPTGAPAAQARQHVEAPPPRASRAQPALPPAVDAVLARGLAKEPSQRPLTATAFVGELELALDAQAPATVEPTRPIPAVLPTARARRPRPAPLPPAAPPPPPPAAPPPGPSGRERGSRYLPLVMLALAALAVGGIAALASGGDDDPAPRGGASSATQPREDSRASTKKPSPPAASKQPSTSPATPASGIADLVALDARGYGLIKQGRYEDAIAPEQQAVDGFRARKQTANRNYAFALYNLGTALHRSGRSSEAIPYLEERLRISDDRRPLVEQELAAARGAVASGGTAKPGKKPRQRGGDKDRD